MGIRYQKRVNFGDGYGLNLSKSGISTSYRSKYGSVGPRGFSIRTGIPGLTFKSGYGKFKKWDSTIVAVMIFLFIAAIVAYNVTLFLKWLPQETY